MKRRLLELAIVAAAIALTAYCVRLVLRRRSPESSSPARWQAPTVEEAKTAAEEEGMTPPPQEPPADTPRASTGAPLVSEFAAPGAPEAEIAAESQSAETAAGPRTEALQDLPVEPDLAVDSAAELGLADLANEDLSSAGRASDDDMMALAEAQAEDVALSLSDEPLMPDFLSEPSPPFEFDEDELLPDFGSLLEEAEDLARGEALMEALSDEPGLAEAQLEADLLAKYFDDLAATTPDDAAQASPPSAPAVDLPAEPEPAFLSSVEEALGDLDSAPIVRPPRRTAESYLDEGNVYFNVGQYGLAIERYGQAIALDDSLTAAYYNRANAHTRAGDFEKALSDYDRALALQPNDADALNNRGMLHLYRANYAAALADFNGALTADPTDTTVMVNRGLAQLHGGNAAAALVDFQEAARMDSADAAAQYGAAQAAATMGNKEEALRHVARALELDPAYAREAAADQRLAPLQGDEEFLRLLRQSGSRSAG
jgi:tetratricopeptide (TPR) repeat protein